MYFDITTPDKAFDFFNCVMGFANVEWIDRVVLDCEDNIEAFIDKNLNKISSVDISTMKFSAFHITTSTDACTEIKRNGLKCLRQVLSSKTELSQFLEKKGLIFNLDENKLYFNDTEYDVDYSHRKDKLRTNFIESIAHRLSYDPQVNGFFCFSDPSDYSTCHMYPEIFVNIENSFPLLKGIGNEWAKNRKPYVVTFAVDFEDIAWFTFYDEEDDYKSDSTTRLELKKKLIQWSYCRMREDSDYTCRERIFYLKDSLIIRPTDILSCEPL